LLQPAPPYELLIGLDWTRFGTPPYSGGLLEQPIRMMRNIRYLLSVHNSILSWNEANNCLGFEALSKWMGVNHELVEFMTFIWSLEDNG
jgi:hypothetical protein